MSSVLKKDYREYFKLEPAILQKIVGLIKDANLNEGKITFVFTVSKKDNSSYILTDFEKVIKDDNTLRKEIIGVSLIACKPDTEQRKYRSDTDEFVILNWGKVTRYTSEEISLEVKNIGDMNLAIKLTDDIDEQIKRTLFGEKRKPAWLRTTKWFTEKIDLIWQLIVVWFTLIFIDRIFHLNATSKKIGELTTLELFILFSISVIVIDIINYRLLTKLVEKLDDKIANRSIFYWGDVATIFDNNAKLLNNIKWVIIIGFIVSFLAGILTTLLIH